MLLFGLFWDLVGRNANSISDIMLTVRNFGLRRDNQFVFPLRHCFLCRQFAFVDGEFVLSFWENKNDHFISTECCQRQFCRLSETIGQMERERIQIDDQGIHAVCGTIYLHQCAVSIRSRGGAKEVTFYKRFIFCLEVCECVGTEETIPVSPSHGLVRRLLPLQMLHQTRNPWTYFVNGLSQEKRTIVVPNNHGPMSGEKS